MVRVLSGNPAEQAGIRKGDVITKINDENMLGKDVEAVANKIRGSVGSTIKVQLERGDRTLTVSVTRKEIKNPSVREKMIGQIGELTVSRFDSETGVLARKAATTLLDKGAKAIVLDLRGDGGGYVDGAIDLAGLWIDNDLIVSQRAKGKTIDEAKSSGDPILQTLPTVVLVNEGTASASEIVSGALKDYGKARLVGTKTFGKGSVQQIFDLDQGAQLKITIAKWYTPKGMSIDGNGLKPDVMVDLTQKDLDHDKDPQLAKALELLK